MDWLCDDLFCVIVTFLDLPDIASFASVAHVFDECIQGFGLQELARKKYPFIDKLRRRVFTGGENGYQDLMRELSFGESFKQTQQEGGE